MSRFLLPFVLAVSGCSTPAPPQPPPEPDGTVIASGEVADGLGDLEVNGRQIYWLNRGGTLYRYSEEDGAIDLLHERASGFFVREDELFVASEIVERYDLGDLEAEPVQVADRLGAGNDRYYELAVVGDFLYWTWPLSAPDPGEFGRTSLLDGATEVLWTDETNFRSLEISGDEVVVGKIDALARTGPESELSLIAEWDASETGWRAHGESAITSRFAFVTTYPNNEILRIHLDDGQIESLVSDGHNLLGVAWDGEHVYYTRNRRSGFGAENSQGAIVRMRADGSERELIARYQQGPIKIDVNEHAVYWLNNASKEVRMLEKSDIGPFDPSRVEPEKEPGPVIVSTGRGCSFRP